jgi:hypothetical protein
MSGAIPPLPNMPSWHGAKLKKHRNNFYFTLPYRKSKLYSYNPSVYRKKRIKLKLITSQSASVYISKFLISDIVRQKQKQGCNKDA